MAGLLEVSGRAERSAANPQTEPGIAGYERFLAARDGEPDLLRHTLSKREALFARLAGEPVRPAFRPDRDQYLRNVKRKKPESGLDRRMLWLLATAKSNQAERFAVGLAELYGRLPIAGDDRILLHVHLQETYHTRILADVVAIFGLPVQPRPPSPLVRLLIQFLVFTPPRYTLPLSGASEMAGCVFFRALRDIGMELFAGEPEVVERVRTLFNEILADEIGHVGYIAARLGPGRRGLMRRLYAGLGSRLVGQMPELSLLLAEREWALRFDGFCLDEMAEDCGGLAYAAGSI
jgi:hypothetical protein